ncbi:MAG: hypothetical protein GY870_04800, partial [archaeon]|nr:hypothetical protein [archaeon]
DFYLTEFDTNNYGDYVLIWKIGLLTLFSGMGVLLYIIDGLLFKGKDKYFFTIAYIVTMIIILITPDIETAQSISMMAMVFVMIVPLGYGYIAAKSTGEVRKKSIYVIVGVIMWAVCSALTAKDLVDVFTTVLPVYLYDIHSIMNIAKTIGIIFMAKGYL